MSRTKPTITLRADGKAVPLSFHTVGELAKYERMIAALKEAPQTSEDLCATLFSSKTPVNALLKRVTVGEHRHVRICRWLRTKGQYCPVYALGSAPDAPKPSAITPNQRYWDIKANAEKFEARRLLILDKKRRDRAEKHPGLVEHMETYVKLMRRCHTVAAAAHFGIAVSTASATLRQLEEDKIVMRLTARGVMPIVWATYDPDWQPETQVVQKVVRKWQPPKIAKQSIFAALGL